jgi:hypothetical protein
MSHNPSKQMYFKPTPIRPSKLVSSKFCRYQWTTCNGTTIKGTPCTFIHDPSACRFQWGKCNGTMPNGMKCRYKHNATNSIDISYVSIELSSPSQSADVDKLVDTKYAETKPAEVVNPVDIKLDDIKPDDIKPDDIKPVGFISYASIASINKPIIVKSIPNVSQVKDNIIEEHVEIEISSDIKSKKKRKTTKESDEDFSSLTTSPLFDDTFDDDDIVEKICDLSKFISFTKIEEKINLHPKKHKKI